MPQMAPLNWLSLFFLFISIFMLFNYLNYYLLTYNKNYYYEKKIFKNYWKW
uniref:ATP synthase complex subunit 8 n=1 Tax=Spilopyra sumptuosa TaxID=284356 RepID=U3L0C4_9CUCU|nr:ATP synthase F0 subunit 8 [Spilopyra sumptuosa]